MVGAVQVYAGLTLVNKVGAGPLVGLTVTACLLASLAIDHFGWFRMDLHPLTLAGDEKAQTLPTQMTIQSRSPPSPHAW